MDGLNNSPPFYPFPPYHQGGHGAFVYTVQGSRYLLPCLPLPVGSLLSERRVTPIISGQHSSQVYLLLSQRAVMTQQFLTATLMESYLKSLIVFSGQRSAWLGYLAGHGPWPAAGYDLIYAAAAPATLFQGSSRPCADSLKAQLQAMPTAIEPACRQCLAATRQQKDFYASQLDLNGQQLTFSGQPSPALPRVMPMAYPLSDVMAHLDWLQRPGRRPKGYLRGYPGHRPPGGYFAPRTDPPPPCNRDKRPATAPPASAADYQPFNYPARTWKAPAGTPPSPERRHNTRIRRPSAAGKKADSMPKTGNVRAVTENKTKNRPKNETKRTTENIIKKAIAKNTEKNTKKTAQKAAGSESLKKMDQPAAADIPVIPKKNRVILNAEKLLPPYNRDTVDNGALGQSIRLLQKMTPQTSRQTLDRLFDTHGQALFISNQLPVNKAATLRFLGLYKQAIAQEQKNKPGLTPPQQRKQNERLQALTAIEQCMANLDEQDPQHTVMLLLMIQASGRIRERSLVSQRTLPFCGGFSIEQIAWGQQPLTLTQLFIDLVKTHRMVLPAGRVITLADAINLPSGHEPVLDKLFITAFYPKKSTAGSIAYTDALHIKALGLPVLLCSTRTPSAQDDQAFLQDLTDASAQKCPIRGAISATLTAYLDRRLNANNYSRKTPNQYQDIDKELTQMKPVKGPGHAIVIEKIRCHGNRVELKIHSWGKVFRITLNRATFFKHISKSGFFLINDPGQRRCFTTMEKEFFNIEQGQPVLYDDQGNIKKFNSGEIIKTPGYGTQVAYTGEGFLIARADQQLVAVQGHKDIIAINQKQQEVVVPLANGQMAAVSRTGQCTILPEGKVATSPGGQRYIYTGDNEYIRLRQDNLFYLVHQGKTLLVMDNNRPVLIKKNQSHTLTDGRRVHYFGGNNYSVTPP